MDGMLFKRYLIIVLNSIHFDDRWINSCLIPRIGCYYGWGGNRWCFKSIRQANPHCIIFRLPNLRHLFMNLFRFLPFVCSDFLHILNRIQPTTLGDAMTNIITMVTKLQQPFICDFNRKRETLPLDQYFIILFFWTDPFLQVPLLFHRVSYPSNILAVTQGDISKPEDGFMSGSSPYRAHTFLKSSSIAKDNSQRFPMLLKLVDNIL